MTTDTAAPLLDVVDGPGYQTWVLGHAPVNAISPELLDALDAAIAAVRDREDVSVIVLGSSLRVFSAGADAGWMAKTVAERGGPGLLEDFNATMDRFRLVCVALRELPKLTVAAIDGHAIAGGLELAAACDLRFCSDAEKVQLGVPEMDLFGAMPSGGGGVQFLARLLGAARALEFILEAKPVNPQRAEQIGLVQRLYPAGEVRAGAETFAGEVAAKAGSIGVAAAKRAIFGGSELPLTPAMELDSTTHWDAMRRGNFLRGVDAFVAQYGQARS